jgi:hypothetical protein
VDGDCDDGVGCTDDTCVAGTCVYTPNDANCANGIWCDGEEACDSASDCQPGVPPNCDDGIDCTLDMCNEANDACMNIPNDGPCDNDVFCDGSETCDAQLGCQPGPDPCITSEWCHEGTDACIPYGTGDFEPDGDVDLTDFAAFQACFGQPAFGGCEQANMTGDEIIGEEDFTLFAANLTGPL